MAEIQSSFVSTMSEIEECLSGQTTLLHGHWLDVGRCGAEEGISLPYPLWPELLFDHHAQSQIACHADPAGCGTVDQSRERSRLPLAIEDRHHGGRVDYHFGRPSSS